MRSRSLRYVLLLSVVALGFGTAPTQPTPAVPVQEGGAIGGDALVQDTLMQVPQTSASDVTADPKERSILNTALYDAVVAALRVGDTARAADLATELERRGAFDLVVAARSVIREATLREQINRAVLAAAILLLLSMMGLLAQAFKHAQRRRAATYYALGLYLLIPCLGVVVAAWLPQSAYLLLGHFGDSFTSAEFQKQFYLIVLSCALGAIGGAMNISLEVSDRNPCPDDQVPPFSYYFFRPFNGLFMAGVMYVALMSGQLVLFGDTKDVPSVWAVALLALVTGLFADQAKDKLSGLGNSLLGARRDAAAEASRPEAPPEASRGGGEGGILASALPVTMSGAGDGDPGAFELDMVGNVRDDPAPM